MPFVTQQKAAPLDRILAIDDLPLMPLALQEVFRSVNPSALVEYSANIFTALSAKTYAGTTYDLVIAGSFQDHFPTDLQQTVDELKNRFGQPLIMIYSTTYDPFIIEKMKETGVDAYVHKYEPIDEIHKAYRHLSAGESYVSGIFHTLYYDYGYGMK